MLILIKWEKINVGSKHCGILDDYTLLSFCLSIEIQSREKLWVRVYRLTSYSADHSGCLVPNNEDKHVVRVREGWLRYQYISFCFKAAQEAAAFTVCCHFQWFKYYWSVFLHVFFGCLPVWGRDSQDMNSWDISRSESVNWWRGNRCKRRSQQRHNNYKCHIIKRIFRGKNAFKEIRALKRLIKQ